MNVRSIGKGDSSIILRLVERNGPFVAPHKPYVYWMLENYYVSTCKVIEVDNNIKGFVSGMPSVDMTDLKIIDAIRQGAGTPYELALKFTGGKIHRGVKFFLEIVVAHLERLNR